MNLNLLSPNQIKYLAKGHTTKTEILTQIYDLCGYESFVYQSNPLPGRDEIMDLLCINPNTHPQILERLWLFWDNKLVESNIVIPLLILENPLFLSNLREEAEYI